MKLTFPGDYVSNEGYRYAVCYYFREIFKHLQQSENNMLVHLGVTKKNINCDNLMMALFERNDFELFTGFIEVHYRMI